MRWLVKTAGLCFAFLVGCAPPVSYHFRVREVNAPATLPVYQDTFVMNQGPRGKADIVVIVDNTDNFEQALAASAGGQSDFEQAYRQFATQLQSGPTSQVDYRLQIYSDPIGNSPKATGSRNANLSEHFEELFEEGRGIFSPTHRNIRREGGIPNHTVTRLPHLLNQAPFERRKDASLFVTLFSASDVKDDTTHRQSWEALKIALGKERSPFRTHWFEVSLLASRGSRSNRFYPTPNLTRALDQLSGHSPERYNLGEPGFPSSESVHDNWTTDVPKKIAAFQKRFLLTHVPFEPNTMTVYSDNQSFRSPGDFSYQETTNELIFEQKATDSLPPNGIIYASYSLGPGNQEVPGARSPSNSKPGTKP